MTQDDLTLQAYPLEAMTSSYPVNYNFPDDSTCSEFSFFEDGKQRTLQIGFIPTLIGSNQVLLPVHFFVVASVILKREGRELKVWQAPEIQQGIFIERSLVPNQQVLEIFESRGLDIIGISAQGGDYYDLKRLALQESKKRRLAVEDQWLIGNSRGNPKI